MNDPFKEALLAAVLDEFMDIPDIPAKEIAAEGSYTFPLWVNPKERTLSQSRKAGFIQVLLTSQRAKKQYIANLTCMGYTELY